MESIHYSNTFSLVDETGVYWIAVMAEHGII